MDDTPTTRLSLLVRLRDPTDEQAWAEFTQIYGPLINRLARRKGLQDADAADLVQEVFCAVAKAVERDAYDVGKGSFRGWLFTIARNLAVNFLISRDRHPRGTGDTGMNGLLEAHPAYAEEHSAIFDTEYKRQLLHWAAEQVRGEFSELTWQAFWKTGVEGTSAKEVAEALETTVGTVYHCKSKVMARLRQKIEQVEGEMD
jgi:RNA polymerase sigma-70 factor (ECF subfamily)